MNIKKKTGLIAVIAILAAVTIGGYLVLFEWNRPQEETVEATGTVELPTPSTDGDVSVEEAIEGRRSVRSYTDDPLDIEEISQLLWSAQGITDAGRNFRSAPSAGATYPLEVYLVVSTGGVTELGEGVYRYRPGNHLLENVMMGDVVAKLKDSALGQDPVGEAAVNIVISADYERTTATYGDRGERYVHMEAGHVGQNIYLQAETLELGTVVIGAFDDAAVGETLGLHPDLDPLYIVPVGRT